MMFVDSLHINRWLCGDNVQHIVPVMMHTHTHLLLRGFCFFFYPKTVTHLLISLFQKKSAEAFQVYEQGFLNRCHLVSTQCEAATTKQNQFGFVAIAAEKVHNKEGSLSPAPTLPVYTSCLMLWLNFTHLDDSEGQGSLDVPDKKDFEKDGRGVVELCVCGVLFFRLLIVKVCVCVCVKIIVDYLSTIILIN